MSNAYFFSNSMLKKHLARPIKVDTAGPKDLCHFHAGTVTSVSSGSIGLSAIFFISGRHGPFPSQCVTRSPPCHNGSVGTKMTCKKNQTIFAAVPPTSVRLK